MSLIPNVRISAALMVGLALLLSACADELPPAPKAKPAPAMEVAGSPPPSAVIAEPEVAEPEPGEEAAPAVALTIADGDAARGAKQYALLCTSCHGVAGKGDGPVAAGLDPKPTDHTDSAYMASLSDDHLYKVVNEGGAAVGKSPLMAPWGGALNEGQLWDVVAHMRVLAQ